MASGQPPFQFLAVQHWVWFSASWGTWIFRKIVIERMGFRMDSTEQRDCWWLWATVWGRQFRKHFQQRFRSNSIFRLVQWFKRGWFRWFSQGGSFERKCVLLCWSQIVSKDWAPIFWCPLGAPHVHQRDDCLSRQSSRLCTAGTNSFTGFQSVALSSWKAINVARKKPLRAYLGMPLHTITYHYIPLITYHYIPLHTITYHYIVHSCSRRRLESRKRREGRWIQGVCDSGKTNWLLYLGG